MTEGGVVALAFMPKEEAARRWLVGFVVRLGRGRGRVVLVPQGSDKRGDALSEGCRCIVWLVRQWWDKTSGAQLTNGWRQYRCWAMLSSFVLSPFAFCPSPFAFCHSPFALRPSPFVLCPSPLKVTTRGRRNQAFGPNDAVRPAISFYSFLYRIENQLHIGSTPQRRLVAILGGEGRCVCCEVCEIGDTEYRIQNTVFLRAG